MALLSCDGGVIASDQKDAGGSNSAGGGSGKDGATGSLLGGGSSTGGSTSTGGATGAGGATTTGAGGAAAGAGGVTTGTGGSVTAPPCTNNQHPDHLDQPCSIWPQWDATKGPGIPKDCDAAWLTGAGYCLESCGKCRPAGSTGSGGSGGAGGSGGGITGGSGGGGSTGTSGTLGPGPNLPNITSGTVYWASRYWDCCKTHCATNAGAKSCGSDGISSNNGSSACAGGSAYACYSEAPRAIGDNVSYGHVAVPNPDCNACYHLQFTGTGQFNPNEPGSQAIAGKHMIVKVSNTGGDVAGNQFDLMIPGGGVGQNAGTCSQEWGVSSADLGATQGGFVHYPDICYSGSLDDRKACVRQKCNLIPAGTARDGCLWWVDWLQLADDPNFRFEPIACPPDI
jgi:hypothetical protein